jgi:hypothetical protein
MVVPTNCRLNTKVKEDRNDLIEQYLGYNQKEMFSCLLLIHDLKLSPRQLKRVLSNRGLTRRKNSSDHDNLLIYLPKTKVVPWPLEGSVIMSLISRVSVICRRYTGICFHSIPLKYICMVIIDLVVTCLHNAVKHFVLSYISVFHAIG